MSSPRSTRSATRPPDLPGGHTPSRQAGIYGENHTLRRVAPRGGASASERSFAGSDEPWMGPRNEDPSRRRLAWVVRRAAQDHVVPGACRRSRILRREVQRAGGWGIGGYPPGIYGCGYSWATARKASLASGVPTETRAPSPAKGRTAIPASSQACANAVVCSPRRSQTKFASVG